MFFTLVSFFVALGILITFHELGHYWVARYFGVRILKFSIGFGKVLLKRVDRHGTEWAISAIPLGGYVKMLDENSASVAGSQTPDSFQAKSVWQRFAIVSAGPIFNLVLAVLLYALINFVGTNEPAAIIGAPPAQSSAAQAGLQAGDRITVVNQQSTESWSQVRWALMQAQGEESSVEIEVERQGQFLRKSLLLPAMKDPASSSPSEADPMVQTGLRLQASSALIRSVAPGSVSEQAGLQPGDMIKGIDQTSQPDISQVIELIQKNPDQRISLKIERSGTLISIPVVPLPTKLDNGQVVGRIGIQLGGNPTMVLVSYGPIDSLARGFTRTVETAGFTLRMMGKMLTGDVSWKNVSGPVTIADYAGQSARIGWVAYVSFLALVSISLGVLNLLPIPMLDGGHLLYYLYEIVRGKPPSARWVEIGQRAGLALLASLMILALFNDLMRIFI